MRHKIASYLRDIVSLWHIIFELAKRDFQRQYRGSWLGLTWMFIQPLVFVALLYLVFTFGFRTPAVNGEAPYSLYLVAGVISWTFFSTNLGSMAHVLDDHGFLVKVMDFRLGILPLVTLLSSMVAHSFLIFVAILLCWLEGYPPTLYTFQILYYLLAMQALLTGLGWLTSSTHLFVRDVSKIVEVITQFGFWVTPVFWSIHNIPDQYKWIIKLNPAYYIITGYRDSLIERIGFWEKPDEALTYWIITLVLMFIGVTAYRKLRPHFAEMV